MIIRRMLAALGLGVSVLTFQACAMTAEQVVSSTAAVGSPKEAKDAKSRPTVSRVPNRARRKNYNESKVPDYDLPDPLTTLDGKRVRDKKTWRKQRRPEILKLFEKHVYGRAPDW